MWEGIDRVSLPALREKGAGGLSAFGGPTAAFSLQRGGLFSVGCVGGGSNGGGELSLPPLAMDVPFSGRGAGQMLPLDGCCLSRGWGEDCRRFFWPFFGEETRNKRLFSA